MHDIFVWNHAAGINSILTLLDLLQDIKSYQGL